MKVYALKILISICLLTCIGLIGFCLAAISNTAAPNTAAPSVAAPSVAAADKGYKAPSSASANQATETPPTQDAIVKISSPQGGCFTGSHLGDGRFVTALHGIAEACASNICPVLQIESNISAAPRTTAERIDQEKKHTGLCAAPVTITHRLPSIDLAVLACALNSTDLPQLRLSSATVSIKEDISLISYPRCQKLEVRKGQVKARSLLSFAVTARGNRGSSGGAIVDNSGDLIGIATRANSVLDGAINYIVGSNFTLSASNSTTLQQLLASDSQIALRAAEAWLLATQYRDEVIRERSFNRLFRGLDFVDRTDRVLALLSLSPDSSAEQLVSALVSYQGPASTNSLLPRVLNAQELTSKIEALVIAKQFERFGVRLNQNSAPSADWFITILGNTSRPEHVKEYLKQLAQSLTTDQYPGAIMMERVFFFSIGLLALFIASLWSLSLGLTWGWQKGRGIYYRIWVTSLVALFWPISFIAFLIREKMAGRKGGRTRGGTSSRQ